MIALDLGWHRRAHVWIGVRPPALFESADALEIAVPGRGRCPEASGGVELFVPRGGHYMYGLLGGGLTPLTSDGFSMVARLATSDGRPFSSDLCTPGDDLRVGLPAEFGSATQAGVLAATKGMEPDRIPAGRLVLDCAVHSTVGSSLAIFRHLTAILIRILTMDDPTPSEGALAACFPEAYE